MESVLERMPKEYLHVSERGGGTRGGEGAKLGPYENGFPARDRSIEGGNMQRVLPKISWQPEQKRNSVAPHEKRQRHSNLGRG